MPALVEPSHLALPDETIAHGCFETMRAYHRRIFRLDDHLDRLYASAQFLGTQAPRDPRLRRDPANGGGRRRLARQLLEALARSGLRDAVVRVALIPSPVTSRRAQTDAEPVIMVQPVQRLSASVYARGIRAAVVPTRKTPVSVIDLRAKYSARLGSVLAIQDAQLRGADEALFMDALGYVTESTASNFGLIKRGVLYTSPCALGLLAGITRDVLFEVAQALRIPVREIPLTRHELYNADEAFLSSTLKEVLGVTWIDGRRIGTGRPGPCTKRLRRAFAGVVRRELGVR